MNRLSLRLRERKLLLKWLRQNPQASTRNLVAEGFQEAFHFWYGFELWMAKEDAGLSVSSKDKFRSRENKKPFGRSISVLRSELLNFLQNNPGATTATIRQSGFSYALKRVYRGNIAAARKDAGLVPRGWVSLATCARKMRISTQRLSILAKQGRIPSLRLGGHLYVPVFVTW